MNIQRFLHKNSSTMLSLIATVGVITTTSLAIKASPKALENIEKLRDSKENVTKIDIVKATWKCYIPTTVSGLSTIICILGANHLSRKSQASLISSYALLNSTFNEYKDKLKEKNPELLKDIDYEIAKKRFLENKSVSNYGEDLYFDYQSMTWFHSNDDFIKEAERMVNDQLYHMGIVYLNDVYNYLGVNTVSYGYDMGWSLNKTDRLYGEDGIKFVLEEASIADDIECKILTFECQPEMEFIH